jgi:hypothetical protein
MPYMAIVSTTVVKSALYQDLSFTKVNDAQKN